MDGGDRPDGAPGRGFDGPDAVEVVFIRSRVSWREDPARRVILDAAATLGWEREIRVRGTEREREIRER